MNNTIPAIEDTMTVIAEVIGIATAASDANFFDLGGDSLTAAHLSLLLEEKFGGEVDVFTIYAAEDLTEIHEALVRSLTEAREVTA
ncbi:phosphopantetheine-binding protein [Amycolatopsis sp. GM8]|uniref:phosphopantetheine-binding protein n=1 Tax=Amycolatopsis sp. GM8 TaxID=2896530 RepID=UPI001F4767C6|nr:phosphopantetheine-binding protein [Amycolatopsis sp. GM8]